MSKNFLNFKIDLLDISKNNNTLLHAMLGSARGMVNKDGWLPGMLESVISARLPEYIEKLKLKRQLKEQAKNELLKNEAKLTPNNQQQKLVQIITAKINQLAKEQGCSIQHKNILHKLITEDLATFKNQQELNEWGEKFYFSKAAVTNAGVIKELPLIVAIAAGLLAEIVIGGVVITSLCAAALVVYGFEKYKEYKNNAARFTPQPAKPTILVTPQAGVLPKIPGFDSTEAIPSTSTEFPGESVEIAPGVFVPSELLPENVGVQDLSVELNRPKNLLFSEKASQEREKNKSSGIPESALGPSGKPKIIKQKHTTRKRALDKSISRSRRGQAPEEHVNPKISTDHFHPSGSNHREPHTFPKKSQTYHPPKYRD